MCVQPTKGLCRDTFGIIVGLWKLAVSSGIKGCEGTE